VLELHRCPQGTWCGSTFPPTCCRVVLGGTPSSAPIFATATTTIAQKLSGWREHWLETSARRSITPGAGYPKGTIWHPRARATRRGWCPAAGTMVLWLGRATGGAPHGRVSRVRVPLLINVVLVLRIRSPEVPAQTSASLLQRRCIATCTQYDSVPELKCLNVSASELSRRP